MWSKNLSFFLGGFSFAFPTFCYLMRQPPKTFN